MVPVSKDEYIKAHEYGFQVLIRCSVDGKWYPTLRLGIRRLMVVPACLRDADTSALDVVMPVELEIEPGRAIVSPP